MGSRSEVLGNLAVGMGWDWGRGRRSMGMIAVYAQGGGALAAMV